MDLKLKINQKYLKENIEKALNECSQRPLNIAEVVGMILFEIHCDTANFLDEYAEENKLEKSIGPAGITIWKAK